MHCSEFCAKNRPVVRGTVWPKETKIKNINTQPHSAMLCCPVNAAGSNLAYVSSNNI
jgi:hypothetical protein